MVRFVEILYLYKGKLYKQHQFLLV